MLKASQIKLLVCEECEEPFKVRVARAHNQKLCPTCLDQREATHKHVDAVVVDRVRIWSAPVVIASLPGEWQKRRAIKSNAEDYWKIEVRGSDFGTPWTGQITINSPLPTPPQVGDTVYMRVMQARKRVKQISFGRSTAVLPVWTTEEDLPQLVEEGKLSRHAIGHPLVETTVNSEYVVLDATNRPATHKLVWEQSVLEVGESSFHAKSMPLNSADWLATVRGGTQYEPPYTQGVLAAIFVPDDAQKAAVVEGFDDYEEFGEEDLLGKSLVAKLRALQEEEEEDEF